MLKVSLEKYGGNGSKEKKGSQMVINIDAMKWLVCDVSL